MITLNSDLGESYGIHSFGHDDELLELIDIANIACGYHAGDPGVMWNTVDAAVSAGIPTGAHPGLPDPIGFGRRAMVLSPREIRDLILYQVGALTGFLASLGGSLNHIKPHGALYGMLATDLEGARALCEVAELYQVPVLGMAGSAHERAAAEREVPFVRELYVDIDYRADGTLAIGQRKEPVSPSQIEARVRSALTSGTIDTVDGGMLSVEFDSICIHSDSRTAVDSARIVRDVRAEIAVE
ncbi:5-oxoprolinase subunit PxpA [Rhodococcoides yunnanense]|uniref:5-oxoprolinase subunit PxpA n=1 Tax=Rhodococcoides yunnanense TaxID=278209 RepID=UPI000932A0DD|nr:5-oxoprolinase subunit PxpA [Rhodococcus yunnanensis]